MMPVAVSFVEQLVLLDVHMSFSVPTNCPTAATIEKTVEWPVILV